MDRIEEQLRQDIVEVGRCMWLKGWVAANDGNISVRLDENRVLCTPTGMSKGRLQPDDLIICDMEGNKISGKRERTSEIMMHLTIYKLRPDVRAVVHAHPPVATGFATAGRGLVEALLPEVIIGLGCVPLAEYGLPGTPELTRPMLPLIPKYDALLMGNHGAVAYGTDVWKAYYKMETVEHFARITLVAELLGGPRLLPRQEVQKLFESRARYGIPSRTGPEPGCPVALEDAPAQQVVTLTRQELVELVKEVLKVKLAANADGELVSTG